ncbi:MAG: DNA polymerase IV [Desulfobacteraceae bacterium]|nr:DNA polymerase IV [Desulfobacteraceae bacterium]
MICHIDMDAFFAAVEQRDNPSLLGKPIIISGHSKRSVVSTASYEARKFGIRSAMPVFQAKERCPNVIIVPGNMKKYRENSKRIMEIISRFSPLIEQVSIDEAFLDTAGCERLFGSPEQIAVKIKKEIYKNLSLTCSIGIASLKFLAKIASDMNKPDGLTIIEKAKTRAFILNLPISKVPGVGKSAMKHMDIIQVKTLGDIQKFNPAILKKKFGKMGEKLLELSNGLDTSKVETDSLRKSISSETTLSNDTADNQTIRKYILAHCQRVGKDLRKKELFCSTISIKLKFSDFTQITRSKTLDTLICSSSAIFDTAISLFDNYELKKKVRLIGVGVSSLKDKDTPVQMLIIQPSEKNMEQWESVDMAVDSISEKFGSDVVKKANLKYPKKTKGEKNDR